MGDAYVKDEFRKHREVENPLQIVGFLTQWKLYLDEIEKQMDMGYKGKQLDMQQFEKVRRNHFQAAEEHCTDILPFSSLTSNCISCMN